MSTQMNDALLLASYGLYVFPCKPYPDKKPYTEHGLLDASTDSAKIKEWWTRWPDALIGVNCGMSGLLCMDFDQPHVYLKLKQQHPELVRTWSDDTPRPGKHLFYKAPAGVKIKSADKPFQELPGVDTKSDGGYAIVYHPEDYVEPSKIPGDLLEEIVTAGLIKNTKDPEPLVKPAPLARPEGKTPGPDYWVDKYSQEASVGTRHEKAAYLAAQLQAEGLGEREAEYYMRQYQRAVDTSKNPYTEREALDSLHYVYNNYPQKEPVVIKDPPYLKDTDGSEIKIDPEKVKAAEMAEREAKIKAHDEQLKQEKAEAIKAETERELGAGDTAKRASALFASKDMAPRDVPKWTLLGLDDIMKERPPRTWNIQGMIPAMAVVLIVGIGGIGKTYFVLYAAACLAVGRPIFPDADGDGIPVSKTRVLFVCAEMNEDEVARRLKAILRGLNLTEEEMAAFGENFKFVAIPEPPLRLDDVKSLNVLGQAVFEHKAEVAIIDHLNAVKGIAKENSDEMGALVQSLREYIGGALKCSPWIVHHQRKVRGENGDEAAESRGHSSIKDNSDVVLQLTRKEGAPTKYAITKTKYGEGKAVYATIDFQNDEAGDIIAVRFSMADNKAQVTNKGAEQAIYDTLTREHELPKGELIKLVQGRLDNSGCSSGDKFLADLMDDMEKARKLTYRWGGKTHRTCYVSWCE